MTTQKDQSIDLEFGDLIYHTLDYEPEQEDRKNIAAITIILGYSIDRLHVRPLGTVWMEMKLHNRSENLTCLEIFTEADRRGARQLTMCGLHRRRFESSCNRHSGKRVSSIMLIDHSSELLNGLRLIRKMGYDRIANY